MIPGLPGRGAFYDVWSRGRDFSLHSLWLVQLLRRIGTFPTKENDLPARARERTEGEAKERLRRGQEQFNFGVGPPGGSSSTSNPPIHDKQR